MIMPSPRSVSWLPEANLTSFWEGILSKTPLPAASGWRAAIFASLWLAPGAYSRRLFADRSIASAGRAGMRFPA